MTESTFSSPLSAGKRKNSPIPGNITYALFILFGFWTGAQLLSMLVHAPGIFERLMQIHSSARPHVKLDLAVRTLFGLATFLLSCVLLGAFALMARWRRHF